MRRKIDLSWEGRNCSFLWHKREREKFYCYYPERDLEEVHDLFDGENYYSSNTGLTGAGYILPDAYDVVIVFGSYHPRGGQRRAVVGKCGRKPIFGYVPFDRDGEPVGNLPVVLTDGRRIYFVPPGDDVGPVIADWNEHDFKGEGRKIEVEYYTGDEWRSRFIYLLANGCRGVDALRFADLREAQRLAREAVEVETTPVWASELGVRKGLYGNLLIFHPRHNYVSGIVRKGYPMPKEINGWSVEHYEQENRLYCFRQRGFAIEEMAANLETGYTVKENWRAAYTYDPIGDEPKDFLFAALEEEEEEISRRKQAEERAWAAAQENIAINSCRSRLLEAMRENPQVSVGLSHSDAVGNCPKGAAEFIARFELAEENRMSDLLEHGEFDEMFENYYFRKAVLEALLPQIRAARRKQEEAATVAAAANE